MSMAIGHFAFGFTATVVILVTTGLHRRLRRLGLVGVVGGVWAMVPDVGQMLPGNPALDHTPWVNVFWFHYFLDTHEFTDGLGGSVLFVALMIGTVFVIFTHDVVVWVRHRTRDVTIADGGGRE